MPPEDKSVSKKIQNSLRRIAEEQLLRPSPVEVHSRATWEKLYELQTHQIDPRIHDDELRNEHIAPKVSRDRYMDLYDFFPIGYLTLSGEGIIIEANLAAAALLGVERNKLIHRSFAHFL